MKHKTTELEGALLDAAVAKAEGRMFEIDCNQEDGDRWCIVWRDYGTEHGRRATDRELFRPSTDGDEGIKIIYRARIDLIYVGGGIWGAKIQYRGAYVGTDPSPRASGPTPLIAAMRAYVASKLGEEVELP